LYLPGVNDNDSGDSDSGPNQEMNYPEIDTVTYQSGETIIIGTLETPNPELCNIEIFIAQLDPTGFGEGKTYLTTTKPEASGYWSDTISGIQEGIFLTTTATDDNNNTSEFSICASSFYPVYKDDITESDIRIFPNPTSGEFTVIGEDMQQIEILDITGKTVSQTKISIGKNKSQSVDLCKYTKGLYFVRITVPGGIIIKKLTVQ